jgi:hypothetical protein
VGYRVRVFVFFVSFFVFFIVFLSIDFFLCFCCFVVLFVVVSRYWRCHGRDITQCLGSREERGGGKCYPGRHEYIAISAYPYQRFR